MSHVSASNLHAASYVKSPIYPPLTKIEHRGEQTQPELLSFGDNTIAHVRPNAIALSRLRDERGADVNMPSDHQLSWGVELSLERLREYPQAVRALIAFLQKALPAEAGSKA